jgi:hypothetical protein
MRLHQAEVTQTAIQAVEPHERTLATRAAHLFTDHGVVIHGGRVTQAPVFPRLETFQPWKNAPCEGRAIRVRNPGLPAHRRRHDAKQHRREHDEGHSDYGCA